MNVDRSDIKSNLAWPIVIFGNSYMARCVSRTYGKDVNGEDIIILRILPTQELIKKHGIPPEEMDDGTITRSFPINMLKTLSDDPGWPVWICYLDLNAKNCPGTDVLLGKSEADKVASLMRIINLLKAENAYLIESLEKAKSNVRRYLNDDIVGPAQQIGANIMAQQQQTMDATKNY